MPALARIGDTISHGGTIIGGSAITSDKPPIARVGDAVSCDIHGSQTISSGSATRSDLDGKGIARIGDSISCGAVITSGDVTVTIN